jgi:hypothetical protein
MNQPIQSSGMNQMNAVSSWRRNWYLHLNQFHIGAPCVPRSRAARPSAAADLYHGRASLAGHRHLDDCADSAPLRTFVTWKIIGELSRTAGVSPAGAVAGETPALRDLYYGRAPVAGSPGASGFVSRPRTRGRKPGRERPG